MLAIKTRRRKEEVENADESKGRGNDLQAEEQENQSANDGDAREHPSAPKVPATLAPTDDSIKVIPISTPVISSEEVHRRSHVCRMEKEAEVDLLADGLWSRKVMRKGRRRKMEEK
jgi:hypothetical protein